MPEKYDNRHRNLTEDQKKKFLDEGRKSVIRFKLPDNTEIKWHDEIRGYVSVNTNDLGGDPVIMRADGIPLYNFAVVIDDGDMRISHVVRGDDHLHNTAKQIPIFQALGFEVPSFGHAPLIFTHDREKLSKVKPVLKAISGEVLYFGKAGAGMKYKLILNLLQAIHVFGMGEALKLAKDANLDIKAVGDALSVRPGGLATNMAWKNYQQEPTQTNFSVEWITKDLKYAKKLSKSPTLFLNAALKRLQKGLKKSMHQKDWTLVNKLT